ncbi:MBL fold metallo-hydrolase [Streptomyces mobaraensis]|uniref:MBL fold metallo-hydrolase n=1 Tax=Streptomyces mobaraensis TaxID=35621 RepID=A0A5N5W261_STRMB|nr:MBL fold metallo-hydrolase [Streptomyces mobaraensis]KAB7836074.1 MBL fold metallo-hydrolase [Streptomyces mobaraensis]
MRIHHLNCGSLRKIPPHCGEHGTAAATGPSATVCHCLLIETESDGLILVDTGLGTADRRDPEGTLGADWVAYAQPARDPEESALRQVVRLGHAPEDVRHIVLTHLHRDHTGGLPDFPDARVHVHPAEYRAVTDPADPHHRHSLDRFAPAHRAHGPLLTPAVADEGEGARWFGFPGVARPRGLVCELLLVPLPGHSAGHAGVAVRDTAGRWLLHAGDAYMYHGETERTPPLSHPAFDPIQDGAQTDAGTRVATRDRLHALRRDHGDRVTVFSAHDPWEFARLAEAPGPRGSCRTQSS